MIPPELAPAAGSDVQYLVLVLCAAMVLQTVGPKLMELWTRKKLNSEEEQSGDPKIRTMETQVDKLTDDVSDIKDGLEGMRQMQVELLAQFRQMRDDQKDAITRVHERIDQHLADSAKN